MMNKDESVPPIFFSPFEKNNNNKKITIFLK